MRYRGRFAPSPTGPLHFGSLVAAAASYLEARSRGGDWLVRMEDVDGGRTEPGAAGRILFDLERLGFEWDGEVMVQSDRTDAYRSALDGLRANGWAYACGCTRREIAGEGRYPGHCANGLAEGKQPRAWRVRTRAEATEFVDAVQGPQSQNVAAEVGDFVLLRADGYFAYQLAVVVDDAEQGITHVVRGADLLDSTPRQIHLQRLLDLETPEYSHIPVVVGADGAKLSKQTLAPALAEGRESEQLAAALEFLGHAPPGELRMGQVRQLWRWAMAEWRLDRVPQSHS